MGAVTRTKFGAGDQATGTAGRLLLLPGRVAARREAALSPEAQLLQRVRKGDRDAFEELVRMHQAAVYGFLRARLLEPADAEDLCQEVFLRCYTGKVRIENKAALRPWLLGVARNVLREHVRKVRRRREIAWTETALELDALMSEQASDGDEATQHLNHCVSNLGPSARQALDLRYRGQLKLAEIGEHLHRSEGAVKLLMYRARQALRYCLDRKLQVSGDE